MQIVLVVSDNRAVREALSAALPDHAHVLFESTVEEAARRLITLRADAVILDDTPRLGAKALPKLCEAAPDTRIIALSGFGDEESLARLQLAGAAAALPKPFECDALIEALREPVSPAAEASSTAPFPPNTTSSAGSLHQHQSALRWLGRITALIDMPERLPQTLADALTDVFDSTRCAVLSERDGAVAIVADVGLPDHLTRSLRFDFAAGLMRWFEENPYLLDRLVVPNDVAAAKEMALLGARLGMPLMSQGRVVGALLVGEKANGRSYSTEEQELLTTIARCASAALKNTRQYLTIAQEQTHLQSVLGRLCSGVIVVDANRTVTMINNSAAATLRLQQEDVIGRSVQKFGSQFADVVLRAMGEGEPQIRRQVYDPLTKQTLGLSVTPLGDDGAVILFAPIPVEADADVNFDYSPFWEYLAARVAQEIKNPLVAINTFTQLLPRKYDSDEFRSQFSDVVHQEVDRINRVVETLFDFARHPELVLQRTDLHATLDTVLNSFRPELQSAEISVDRDYEANLDEVDMDPVFFSRAFHNVVRNAVEAMRDGGALRVTTHREGDQVRIEVIDSGPGVATDIASLIFLPYFSTKEKGMGLGLTVAGRIARQHQGGLELTPMADGACFSFTLPFRQTAPAEKASANPARRPHQASMKA